MPADEVSVVQKCGKCGAQVSTFSVKKDNLMLTCSNQIWCPHCEEDTPEVRDIEGRLDYIKQETASYPKSSPPDPSRRTPTSPGQRD